MQNHFELFQLPCQFEIDAAQLDVAYREILARVHPDKFVGASAAEQRVAMQWATQANEAYQTLKNPLKRASYLCEINGVDLETESNTAMPTTFLMQQMTWREELDDARNDIDALHRLESEVAQSYRQHVEQIAVQFQQSDFQAAAKSVRQLMFLEKFSADLDHISDQFA